MLFLKKMTINIRSSMNRFAQYLGNLFARSNDQHEIVERLLLQCCKIGSFFFTLFLIDKKQADTPHNKE
jgi:hypothetical protein